MSRLFDSHVIVDWSARSAPSPKRDSADAIWWTGVRDGHAESPVYARTRAEAVAALAGSGHNLSGNQSNDYFRQLLVAGIGTEEIFFAKTPYTRQPDNASSGGKALAAGEVGFGYIMRDATTGLSSSGNPAQTVVAAPLLDARNDWSFDPGPYGDKAVVLRLDQSVQQVPIRQTDQRAIVGGGWPLEQTGEDTAWGDRIQPVLKAPGKLGN